MRARPDACGRKNVIVLEAPEVADYINRSLGIRLSEPTRCFGLMADDRRPLCAVAFNNFTGANIELTIVAEKGGLVRPAVRWIFNYAFQTAGCRRLTVRTRKRNKHVQRMALRFGFRYECNMRHFFADDDAVVYRMLRSECRWIDQDKTK
jgi:hypothetical protein